MSSANDFIIENGSLTEYKGSAEAVIIPDGVTSIGDGAFSDCKSLTDITIPDGVTSIGTEAFYGCSSLTSITIPDGVTSIGTSAFSGCSRLTSIAIPDSVTSIGNGAFWGCSGLTGVNIPDGMTSICNGVFYGCSGLTGVNIPDGVTSIDNSAFSDCSSLTSITIPDSVTSIGSNAFSCCSSLTSITIPGSVTRIGNGAFWECSSLTSVAILEGVTSIGRTTFSSCSRLTSITIPGSVTSIGDNAFSGCSSLTSITIPNSVTSIGDNAFSDCNSLTSITIPDSDCQIGRDSFGHSLPKGLISCIKGLYMHFTDGALKKYVLNESVWPELDPDLQIEIFIARSSKSLHSSYAAVVCDPDSLGKKILARITEKASAKECDAAASFLTVFGEAEASVDLARQLYSALKPLKNAKKALKVIEKNDLLYAKLNGEAETSIFVGSSRDAADVLQSEKKSLQSVTAVLKEYYSLESSELPKLSFADGTQAPDWVLAYLLSAHEEMQKDRYGSFVVSANDKKPGVCEGAQKMLALLDPASLQTALLTIADWYLGLSGRSKKMYLAYPICRYADDDTMNELLKRAPKWHSSVSGNDAPPLATFRKACIYSNCRSVITFADKYGDLDDYAAIRSTDAQTIRDTVLADFGFDADGKKVYDLGGTSVVVTLEKNCTPSLFDTKAGKTVKSIPKRNNDEALVAAASKDFSELKKNIKKVIKNRFTQLFSDFRTGTEQKAENWKKAYMDNPLLRTVANIIVWKQEDKTFILKDTQAICVDRTPYTIGEAPILVAHPMEMTQSELLAWQAYFVDNALKQPFEQIWEPVIRPEDVHEDRYTGVSIPYFRFLNQEKHGIFVEDFDFHADIQISFAECYAEVERLDGTGHSISPNDGFEVKNFSFEKYSRQVNHIVAYLDKSTLYDRIVHDDVSVAQYLKNLTLAQTTKFIELAAQNNCTNVSAILLAYKNEHFADFNPMSEFTLEDW